MDYNPLFGSNVKLTGELPAVDGKIIKETLYDFRYALNFCTYSYTMAFWGWEEYEAFIDWTAMNGVNMMLDIVGQEEVLRQTFKQYGYSDDEIKEYIAGPGYFAWFYMQNLYSYGGPLPDNWFEQRVELGRQMHDRMQAFGIDPVIQGFSGQVPDDFGIKNADSIVVNPGSWPGFQRPYMLKTYFTGDDEANGKKDYFADMAVKFYDAQRNVFGDVSKYYAVDPFHEGGNINGTGLNIIEIYNTVQKKMIESDEDAVWVMQQWQSGINETKLSGLYKKEQAIVLDLQSDLRSQAGPMENQDVPWIWNMLHNFGGRMGLDGRPENVSQRVTEAYNNSEHMVGIGITPEAIDNSPMVYELLFDMTWTSDPINYRDWVQSYAERRYGGTTPEIEEAWDILLETAYKSEPGEYYQGASESIINAKPADTINAASTWGHSDIKYDKETLEKVVPLFAESYEELKDNPGFMYDFVDVTRQMLQNSAQEYHPLMVDAYKNGDLEEFKKVSSHFLNLIDMQDRILNTSSEFMLGTWIEQSRSMLDNQDDWSKDLFEFNARALITTWGPQKNAVGGGLDDYSNRQWGGLTKEFYYPRWEKWINDRIYALENKTTPVNNNWFMYGWEWANKKSSETNSYPTTGSGEDLKALALEAFDLYAVANIDQFINGPESEQKVNLALSKTVESTTASADGYELSALTDGSNEDGWKAATNEKSASLTVDLGEVNNIDGISFTLQQIANIFPLGYSIDVYDGEKWILKVGEDQSGTATSKTEIPYTGIASKVRFNFNTTDGSDLMDIKELLVFGYPQEKPSYINVAGKATASSDKESEVGKGPEKINDGNDSTIWVPKNGAVDSSIKLTFDEAEFANVIVVKPEQISDPRSLAFEVYATIDGEEKLLFERPMSELGEVHKLAYEIPVHDSVKEVRVHISGAKVPGSSINAWAVLSEIEVLKEAEKEVTLDNIAKYAQASSSPSKNAPEDANALIDGNDSVAWVSKDGQKPAWVELDLTEESYVENVVLKFEPNVNDRSMQFILKGIKENGEEIVLLERTKEDLSKPQGTSIDIPVKADIKKVRMDITDARVPSSGGAAWPLIGEIEVYSAPTNVAKKATITSTPTMDNSALQDGDIETSVTYSGNEAEKQIVFDFDRAYDMNALEFIKSGSEAAKYIIEYRDENGNYKELVNNFGNTTNKERTYIEFDKAIYSDQLRMRFLNSSITLHEVRIYEANVSSQLIAYINSVEKVIEKATIGEYAGNYSQIAYDSMIKVIEDANKIVEAGVNSKQVIEEITKLKQALSTFYREGYVSIDRNALYVALQDADITIQALKKVNALDVAAVLQTAYDEAKGIVDTYKVTQNDLNAAITSLTTVLKQCLETLDVHQRFIVEQAKSEQLLNEAIIGDLEGQVSQGAFDALTNALQTARTDMEVATNDEEKQAIIETLITANTVFIESKIVIQRDELRSVLEEANALQEKTYDKTGWEAFIKAKEEATTIVDEDVNQATIDDVKNTLVNTIEKLVVLDRTSLEYAITSSEQLQEAQFTKDSWKLFENARTSAIDLINNISVSQAELDDALKNLKDAEKALQNIYDTTSLQVLIEQVEALQEKEYTEATWKNLRIALAKAKIVCAESTKQSEIDAAKTALQQALEQLVKAEQKPDPEKPNEDDKPSEDDKPAIPQEDKIELLDSETGIIVKGKFDKEVTLSVIEQVGDAFTNLVAIMKERQPEFFTTANIEQIFDIRLLLNDQPHAVQGNLQVKIKLSDALKTKDNLGVVYIDDDGNVLKIPAILEDEYLIFNTSHLSKYAIVSYQEGETTMTTPPPTNTPSTGDTTGMNNVWTLLTFSGIALYVMQYKHNKKIKSK